MILLLLLSFPDRDDVARAASAAAAAPRQCGESSALQPRVITVISFHHDVAVIPCFNKTGKLKSTKSAEKSLH